MTTTETGTYPKALIARLRRHNNVLVEQTIYAVSATLDTIQVWPVDYGEPAEAIRLATNDRAFGLVGLRLADRFVWLSTSEIEALISALRLSYDAVRKRSQNARRPRTRS